jgi:hypothetical protein
MKEWMSCSIADKRVQQIYVKLEETELTARKKGAVVDSGIPYP